MEKIKKTYSILSIVALIALLFNIKYAFNRKTIEPLEPLPDEVEVENTVDTYVGPLKKVDVCSNTMTMDMPESTPTEPFCVVPYDGYV
ncbi:hypothetical protein [Extibacter muris]|uniref:hypothetical protein n=1 Tax=Extibacter muris TaxID=1796622 RepID=UPI001D0762FF|nr:hypothetical protein [Extibacter muris]MCB6202394.1 hypothetical protein [Extibacter muris]MCQ4665324.1 hypothetical protein [Extibacter muris]MCQ4694693.1 hypothetical protein [Extibacter muris]